jgi:anti-sigma factor RsiW
MTMTLARFQRALDVYGADLSSWPQARRAAAERLVASDPAAAAALAQARALDALMTRDIGFAQDDAAAVLRALQARPLPPQRRRFLWRQWPTELLNLDFAPAWPRLAALACVAAFGFAIGLTDVSLIPGTTNGDEAISIVTDNDLGAVVFSPDPLPEVRP